MKWNKYRIKTTTEAEEIIGSMLMDLGIEGIEIEDLIPLTQQDKEQMYIDIMPTIPANDGIAYVSFYLDVEKNNDELLEKVKEELEAIRMYTEVGAGTIEESQTEDLDWINNWKEYFHQFTIDDILVIPSWEEVEKESQGKIIVQIDPGTAFGTGMHDTTQLCIKQLKKYVNQDTVLLDVGCGSGILGMLSLKFGAKYCFGTDLDPCAIEATHENMEVNGIAKDQYGVIQGNVIDDDSLQGELMKDGFDIIVANILTEVLIPLSPVVYKLLKTGGYYITSGIIDCDGKEEKLAKVLKDLGMEIVEVTYQGEWVSITAKK